MRGRAGNRDGALALDLPPGELSWQRTERAASPLSPRRCCSGGYAVAMKMALQLQWDQAG